LPEEKQSCRLEKSRTVGTVGKLTFPEKKELTFQREKYGPKAFDRTEHGNKTDSTLRVAVFQLRPEPPAYSTPLVGLHGFEPATSRHLLQEGLPLAVLGEAARKMPWKPVFRSCQATASSKKSDTFAKNHLFWSQAEGGVLWEAGWQDFWWFCDKWQSENGLRRLERMSGPGSELEREYVHPRRW
jgi:hypothetical protein